MEYGGVSRQVRTRRAVDGGFSLIELLVSVTVLSVALLPVFGSFRALMLGSRRARASFQATTLLETQLAGVRLETRAGILPAEVRAITLARPDHSRWYWRYHLRPAPDAQTGAAHGRPVRVDGRIDAMDGSTSAAGAVRLWVSDATP